MNTDRLVFTISEAAQVLGISRETAYRLAKSNELPTIRIGNLLRVPKVALAKMVSGVEMGKGEADA